MSCESCDINCSLMFVCDRYNCRRDEVVEAVKRTIVDKELTPTVCEDSGQAEWTDGEAQKLAEAIVKAICELEDSHSNSTEHTESTTPNRAEG